MGWTRAAALCAMAGLLVPAPARAAEDGGTRSVFASGAGNRALAMGSGFVAAADDASALVWNPGGLGRVQRAEFQATRFGDAALGIEEFYGALALPSWRWGALGIAARTFGTGDIEQRDDQNVLLASNLSDAETELTLGYGRSVGDAWSLGAAIKFQRQSLAGFAASGMGVDVGVCLRPAALLDLEDSWASGLRLGLTARNAIEPSLKLDRESVPDPATTRAGVAWQAPLAAGWLLATADIEKTRAVGARLHTGLEIAPAPGTAVRVGLDAGRLTAGVGMAWRGLSLDYAYLDEALAADHRVGVTLHFGSSVDASRAAARQAEDDTLQSRLAEAFRRRQAEQTAALLDRAERERAAGRFDQALETIAALGTLAPDDPRVARLENQCLLGRAAAIEQRGDFAAAAMAYELAARGRAPDSLAIAGAARCRAESDRRARRRAELRERFATALDAFARDDLAGARAGFAAVLAGDSLDTDARTMLSRTAEASHRRAERMVDQAAAAASSGGFDDASALLAQAAALDPEAPRLGPARAALARARAAATGSGARAAASAPAVGREAPRMSEQELAALYRRGLEAARGQRADEALHYWEIIWNAQPDYREVVEYLKREYLTRGMEAFAVGRLEEAVTQWQSVLRVDPNDARARGYLARAQQQLARSREILGANR